MRKIAPLIILMSVLISTTNAQQAVTKIKLSGFSVTLVPSTEFSYKYDTTHPTTEELKKNTLNIEATTAKNAENRSTITINYVDLESLELINSDLIHNSPITLDKISLIVDKSSTVNLDLTAKELKVKIKDKSKFGLEGNIKKTEIKIEKESELNSYALTADHFSLSASSKSIAHVNVKSKNVDLDFSSESKLTMAGETSKFKAKANSSSQIDAIGMQVKKAEIESKSESSIKVKAIDEIKSKVNN